MCISGYSCCLTSWWGVDRIWSLQNWVLGEGQTLTIQLLLLTRKHRSIHNVNIRRKARTGFIIFHDQLIYKLLHNAILLHSYTLTFTNYLYLWAHHTFTLNLCQLSALYNSLSCIITCSPQHIVTCKSRGKVKWISLTVFRPNLLYLSLTQLSSSLVLCSSASRLSMQTTVCTRFWWRSAFSSCSALSTKNHRIFTKLKHTFIKINT